MKRTIITLFLLAPAASAQGSIESLGYIAFFFGFLALAYSYHLTSGKKGLEAQIARERAILKKLKLEVKQTGEELEQQKSKKILGQAQITQEMEKMKDAVDLNHSAEGFTRGYWSRLEAMGGTVPVKTELDKLVEEKSEIQGIIEMTKEKYHTRAIDQQSFSNITEEYQKRLIEIEAKIRKLKGEEHGG
jgi:hypothetical protein